MIDAEKIFEQMLKLPVPWKVTGVQLDEENKRVEVYVSYEGKEAPCPKTGEMCAVYDRIERSWRHLDTMDYETWICSQLPRVKNSLGGLHLIAVDWSEPGLSHTRPFENRCILTLQKTHCQKSAADLMGISDDKMCGIMHRSVDRGLRRRNVQDIKVISIDEKSHGRGQRYVSVLTNAQRGEVLDILPGRNEQAATTLLEKVFNREQLGAMALTCCDLSESYIQALKKIARMRYWFMTSSTSSNYLPMLLMRPVEARFIPSLF